LFRGKPVSGAAKTDIEQSVIITLEYENIEPFPFPPISFVMQAETGKFAKNVNKPGQILHLQRRNDDADETIYGLCDPVCALSGTEEKP
jgi:hypothetical protein